MKRFVALIPLLLPLYAQSQAPSATISRELASLINVPALIPEQDPPADGHASGETLRFDKLVLITAVNESGLETQIHLYINTTNGDIATCTGKTGNAEDGSFNIDDPAFTLTYYNPHGRIYNFYTRKKNGNIVRYMSSLNTEIVPYSNSIPFDRTTIYRTGPAINPLPQRFEATTYKASGSNAPILIICGDAKPGRLLLKRFIGYSGIGYIKTDQGIYMVVKIKSARGGFTATKWKNENYKLNLSDFKHVESEMYADMFAKNQAATEKLESKSYTGNCADISNQIKELKLEQKRKERVNIEKMGKGNPITDASVRDAMKGMYGNPIDQLQQTSLEIDLKLCKLDSKRIQTASDAEKRNCLKEDKIKVNAAVLEIQALEARYANPKDEAILITERLKVISRVSTELKCN